jgi:regulator of sirC expression with transglutaminase-like and TPR domain/CBS domain-containing protein
MSLRRHGTPGSRFLPQLSLRLLLLLATQCLAFATADEPANTAPQPLSAEALAAQAAKSLVVIRSTDRTGGELGLGTGFVISSDGLIATAWHVIGDGREIRVELADGRTLPVTTVHASSSQMDLAIIRVEQIDLPPLQLSLEGRTPQGREIVALGHPEGFRNAIVSGVISGYQDIDGVEMLQLAMSIERGNSGGPVLDRQGNVVGIVTRKSALEDKIGFAIPVRLLRDLQTAPNPIPMARWATIGALDERLWQPLMGGNWKQRAGRILVSGTGRSFGGRTLCLHQKPLPERPFDLHVAVRLDDEEGAAGLVFHADGGDRHYGFYPSNGNLRLTRFNGPDVNSWTILHNAPHSAYRPQDWNVLTVRSLADRFDCYLNGQLVVSSKDTVLPAGKAGLAAFRGTVAQFRRFEIGPELLATANTAEHAERLRLFAENVRPERPVLDAELLQILPLGDTAVDFMTQEAQRLEQKSRRLKNLARDLHQTTVRKQLAAELAVQDRSPDLLLCALLIARIDNPDIDPPVYIARLDQLAEEILSKLPPDAPPAARLTELDRLLFQELGLRGSRQEYESPSNSYLNEVIDDREGLPISLSVLYMEMARRLNLNVVGVGLPGHFVVRYEPGGTEMPQTIDVFERGKRLSEQEIRGILAAARFPDEPRFREPASIPAIIERMLMNLLSIAESRRDDDQVLALLETLTTVSPENVEYRAKRLEMRARSGRTQMAIDDADWFIRTQPDGVDVERVRQLRQTLEEQLN